MGVIFGGKSAEHEVSLQSAKNIVDAMDKDKFEAVLIGIDKQGNWYTYDPEHYLSHADDPAKIALVSSDQPLAVRPGAEEGQFIHAVAHEVFAQIDVIFPIVHGTLGEDGSLQGLLRLLNVPYVGPNVLSSAVCMDKDIAKKLLHLAGIHVANGVVVTRREKDEVTYEEVAAKLGETLFIKPANQGSSVGVSKVDSKDAFDQAIDEAFDYDHKVVIEECIVGREIEVSVLGNEEPIASLPGEILPQTAFYSYESKYIDEEGAKLAIPADLPDDVVDHVKQTAIDAYVALQCEGLARVDFFLTEDNTLYVNEINTLPGFTKISMYPKLWEVSGIAYTDLITRLIDLACERFEANAALKSSIH